MSKAERRKRTTEQVMFEAMGKLGTVPGVQVIATMPAPLPGGGNFPVEFIIASTAEPIELLDYANKLVAAAMKSGVFVFADTDRPLDADVPEVQRGRSIAGALRGRQARGPRATIGRSLSSAD